MVEFKEERKYNEWSYNFISLCNVTPILSVFIQFYLFLSNFIYFYPILSIFIQFYLFLSNFIYFYPILSIFIQFYLFLYNFIYFYTILSIFIQFYLFLYNFIYFILFMNDNYFKQFWIYLSKEKSMHLVRLM